MNILEALASIVQVAEALSVAFERVGTLLRQARSGIRGLHLAPRMTYENVMLEAVLDICDRQGRKAVVRRKQRIRFLAEDAGLIRELVWGEGNPLADYRVQGARCLGFQREGSKSVILLTLARRPTKGEEAVISSCRLISHALTDDNGYAEMLVERPTRYVALKVLFPRTRPPREAHLTSQPPSLSKPSIPIRFGRDGRPYLIWRYNNPNRFTTYSLRWSW